MDRPARQGIITTGAAALTIGLFIADLHTPLGVAEPVLYIVPVLLALLSSDRWFPIIVATVATLLTCIGAMLSPRSQEFPLWVPVANRVFSVVVFWTPVLYFAKRRQHEAQLQRLNEELEERVRDRTSELAGVNASLVAEVSERMETERLLEASRHELRQLATQLLRVQEAERRRISRDLHDDINQRLALLAVDVDLLQRGLLGASPNTIREIQAIHERIMELSEDVHHLAYEFHPSILDDLGLAIALQRLAEEFSARTGIAAHCVEHEVPEKLTEDVATCLYRIAQESLTNVARHAKAGHVEVELSRCRDGIQLSIRDDGVGFEMVRTRGDQRGLGLISMEERIRLVDGTLVLTSVKDQGTRVEAWVPLAGRM